MGLARRPVATFLLLFTAACSAPTPSAAPAPTLDPEAIQTTPALPSRPITFLEGGFEQAIAQAKAEKKLLFVDAWAPWCHTCLSMRQTVFARPELGEFERDFVFVEVDTDRSESAPFVERYLMKVWPTFFVIDPDGGAALALHGGSASLEEITALLEEARRARTAGPDAGPGPTLMVRAHDAYARRDLATAAKLYEEAAGVIHGARRTEALLGAMRSIHGIDDPKRCVEFGAKHATSVTGSAAPVDFTYYLYACAKKLGAGAERDEVMDLVHKRLDALLAEPPAGASVDDKADMFALAADVARDEGDAARARSLEERGLAVLEAAVVAAKTPADAQVHDYARMNAYLALERGGDAVRMLEERVRQMPDNYEPHARLASALSSVGKPREALGPIDRAIALSYGPRRLGYVSMKATLLEKLADRSALVATLEELVKGWEALPEAQRDAAKLADAKKRLAAVRPK